MQTEPKFWRMALQDGFGGASMFPECRAHKVAALSYKPIADVDLRKFSRDHKPASWKRQKRFSPSSMGAFAWDINGGDILFVRDREAGGTIIGSGVVRGAPGVHAYRFDPNSPIITPRGFRWKHLIDVDWDPIFSPIPFKEPNAIQNVRELKTNEVRKLLRALRGSAGRNPSQKKNNPPTQPLSEADYVQQVMGGKRVVTPLHRILSNSFCHWLSSKYHIESVQEENGLDVTFEIRRTNWMAEIKICYGGNTRAAIRAAMGQILEYNHWPKRKPKRRWLILLDTPATAEDQDYVEGLRRLYRLPIFLAWQKGTLDFQADALSEMPGS
jgi:hypothetical protein